MRTIDCKALLRLFQGAIESRSVVIGSFFFYKKNSEKKTMAGGRCMRTIDCKAHTQQAKREVVGRARPYDELLAERKAQKATVQQALLTANASAAPMHLRPG